MHGTWNVNVMMSQDCQ